MAGDPLPGHGRAVDVVVVGSANLDLIVRLPRTPQPGETVIADEYGEHPGGKGLNQAVAAAREVTTAFVGSVGNDEAGRDVMSYARWRGVDVASVVDSIHATGRALITLHPDGENVIVVVPLANGTLTVADTRAALAGIRALVALVQFEIPADVVAEVADWARESGVRLVVNPSPIRPMAPELLAQADPLLVNVGEAGEVLDTSGTPDDLARALARLCRSVVVTAGPDGAIVCIGDEVIAIPAPKVEVRDSSGAGDAFAGMLGARLAQGDTLEGAARAAVAVAAETVASAREDR